MRNWLPGFIVLCIITQLLFLASASATTCGCHIAHYRFAQGVKTVERLTMDDGVQIAENYVIPGPLSGHNVFVCECVPGDDCAFYSYHDPSKPMYPPILPPDPYGVCTFHVDIYEEWDPEENPNNATLDIDYCYDPHGRCQ